MDDLKGLSDEELAAKRDEVSKKVAELSADEKTNAAEFTTWVDELGTAVAEKEAIDAELSARAEVKTKAEALKTKVAEFAAKEEADKAKAELAAEKEKADEEKAEADKKAEEEAAAKETEEKEAKEKEEAEAAAKNGEELKISPKGAKAPEDHKAKGKKAEDETPVIDLIASADIPGTGDGSPLSMSEAAKALIARRKSVKNSGNDGEFVLVASAEANYDDDHTLTGDWTSDQEKIRATTGTNAIIASGGICAPSEAWYGLELLSEACRPVKEALPSFSAARGGIRFMTPPSLSQLNGSARITTEAQDTAGYNLDGDHSSLVDPKPSVHVTCGQINEVVVDAISSILTVGNMNARTYPELVQTWTSLAAARHSQVAEINLLDKIAAASTAVTAAKVYGATRSLLSTVDQALAGYVSRHRICNGIDIRVMFPSWVKNLIRTDLTRQAPGDGLEHFYVSDGEIQQWFTARGVSVSFYQDSATSAGQSYGTQSAGAVTDYPGTVKWYLWAEGTFIFLDGGTLDLGLVRDSTLNSINDYSLFVETFENLVFVGHEALAVTSTVEPDGSGPTGATITS